MSKVIKCCFNKIPYKLHYNYKVRCIDYKTGYNIGNCSRCGRLYLQEGKIRNNVFHFEKQYGNAIKKFIKIKSGIAPFEAVYKEEIKSASLSLKYYKSNIKGDTQTECYFDNDRATKRQDSIHKPELKVSSL